MSCKVCRKGFRNQTALNTHLYTCAKSNNIEESSVQEYESLDAIRSFISYKGAGLPILEKNDGETTFHCNFCPKTFNKLSLLKGHVKSHISRELDENLIGDPKVLFQCDICLKKIKPDKMQMHIRENHQASRHRCPNCLQIYTTFDRLKNHVLRMHATNEELLYKCGYKVCNKIFSTSNALKNHIKTHSMEMFECQICEQVLKGKVNFEKHNSKHLYGKSIGCDNCEMKFSSKQALHAHLISKHITITVK